MTKRITKDNMTIQDWIKSSNMRSQFWMNAGLERWSSGLCEDQEHWNDYGITTVEQLKEYLDECSKPSLADEMYYYQQEWEEQQKNEEIAEEKRQVEAIKEMNAKGPLTHNPFKILGEKK